MNVSAIAPVAVTTASTTASAPESFKDVLGDVSDLSVDFGASGGEMPVEGAPEGEQANAAPAAAPPVAEPPAPQIDTQTQFQQFAAQMQQSQQMWMAQQQKNMAEMIGQLPQMFAQALPQPAAPPPVDPYAALDQNDPDYHFNRIGIENKLLQDKLAKLESWRDKYEQDAKAAAEQENLRQQDTHAQTYIRTEVQRSVGSLFKDAPRTPEIEELFQIACSKMDEEWLAGGYQSAAAGRGWQSAKRLVDMFLPKLRQNASANATIANSQQPPLGGTRAPALVNQTQLGEDPFTRLRRTRAADAAELSSIFDTTH